MLDLYDEDDQERKKVKKEYMALLREIVDDGCEKYNNNNLYNLDDRSFTTPTSPEHYF